MVPPKLVQTLSLMGSKVGFASNTFQKPDFPALLETVAVLGKQLGVRYLLAVAAVLDHKIASLGDEETKPAMIGGILWLDMFPQSSDENYPRRSSPVWGVPIVDLV